MTAATAPPLTGPIPERIELVTFPAPATTNVRPVVHACSWPTLARRLTSHTRSAEKDGMGWSPAIYRHDTRGRLLTRRLGSVASLTCAVADVDHVELDDLQLLLDHVKQLGLAGVVYSTHSHTSAAPRVRVVIPFAETVPAETWPRLWPALAEHVFLHLADRAASDASRMYYLPSTPGDETTIADRWDGNALNWRALPLADVNAGPVASVTTTGRGAATTVDPQDLAILERLFSGRRGEQRMRAWTGDYSDFDGNESSADLSIANGLVTSCRGDTARAERIMRAGAWRPKWDERRGATTWLGYTFGKALAAYRAWAGTQDVADEPETAEEVPRETPEQTIARLERELAEERQAVARTRAEHAVQQTVVRAERERRQVLETYVTHVSDVLGRDEAACPSDDKVVLLGFTPWLATHRARALASGSPTAFHLAYAARVVGMHPKRFSKILGRWSSPNADDGAPWYKQVTRTPTVDEDGAPDWDSALEVTPYADSPRETWERALAYIPAERPKKRGGSEHATAHRWGRCANHAGAAIRLDGRCTEGGELVIAVIASADQVDALKSHFVLSDGSPTPTVDAPYLSIAQNGISDGQLELNLQNGIPATIAVRPVSLLDAGMGSATAPPTRCAAPDCTALEFRRLPDGAWRCLKSGHDPGAYLLVAVAGGEE